MPTRVLLVDDEQDFLSVLSERLGNRGVAVETAESGANALELVDKQDYDAVVLDLAMPGLDGIETLKRMLKKNPDLQVILLTGHATIEKGVEATREGAMEFLEKPAKLDLLLEKIGKAREKRVVLVEKRSEQMVTDILKSRGW